MGYEGLKQVIGVDIGTDSLKAVLLERKDQSISCLDIFTYPFPTGSEPTPDAILEGLKNLELSFGKFTRSCALVTSDRHVQLKFFEKPEMPIDTLRTVVEREVKATLAAVEGADKLDSLWCILGKSKTETHTLTHILSTVFPKQLVTDMQSLFKKAGLKLAGMYPFALGLWEIFQKNHLTEDFALEDPFLTALLNFGSQTNQIAVCDQTVMRLGRIFPSGGEELTGALVKSYKVRGQERVVSRDEAEALKKQLGILSPQEMSTFQPDDLEPQLSTGLRMGVSRMAQKLRLSLDYFKGQMKIPVKKAFILGGGANMRGLVGCLGDLLMVPEVQELFPFVNISYNPRTTAPETPPPEMQAIVAMATGAGLCGMKSDEETLNLLTNVKFDIMPYLRKATKILGPELLVGIGAAAIIGLYGYFGYYAPANELKKLQQDSVQFINQATTWTQINVDLKKSNEALLSTATQEKFVTTVFQRPVFWSQVLKEFSRLLPPGVWITELVSLDRDAKNPREAPPKDFGLKTKVKIKGKAVTNADISEFIQRIESSPLLTKFSLEDSRRDSVLGKPAFAFSIEGEVIASETRQ